MLSGSPISHLYLPYISQVGRRPSVPEAREALGSLLAMLSELHRCGCVLASHSPRHVMRFPSGWKLLAVGSRLTLTLTPPYPYPYAYSYPNPYVYPYPYS